MSRNFTIEFLNEISKFNGKTALIWRDYPITYEEFQLLIEKWTQKLKNFKSKSTDPLKIGLFCTNCPDIIAIVLASQLIGITVVPLNPSYKKYEINEYLGQVCANMVIVSDDVDLEKFEDVENVHTVGEILLEDSGDSENSRDSEATETEGPPTSGSILFFSSGTTGPPKPFPYSQRQLTAQLDQLRAIQSDASFFSPTPSDVCYGVLPFFHAGGLITVLSMLFSGCSVVINERWSEQEFLGNCEKFHVSVLFLVPPVMKFLANYEVGDKLKSLKTIFVGAAASSPEDFKNVKERIEGLENLIQLYGTTECGVLLCSTGRGICFGLTVGHPFPLVELKLKDNEILIKSPTAVEEGFMETGDLGCFSYKKNELMIKGRSKEMMKVRGWQVNPNEIEEVVRKVEGVTDCAVYQNSKSELIAKVITCSQSESTKEHIFNIVKDNLASYKRLNDIIFVEELPRNASGKLVRNLLL